MLRVHKHKPRCQLRRERKKEHAARTTTAVKHSAHTNLITHLHYIICPEMGMEIKFHYASRNE